jgi:predicted phage terminase large subunit-like protein
MARRRFHAPEPEPSGRWWYLRYWRDVFVNGKLTRKRVRPPLLAIEDAAAGTQLLDTLRDRWPYIPVIAAKPVKAKIIRAEGVTPITSGGLVALPKEAEWRNAFIAELANFPVGMHDDVVDAFCHAIKSFTTGRAFRTPDLQLFPGRLLTEEDVWEQDLPLPDGPRNTTNSPSSRSSSTEF